jgi:hypothetical protein
MKVILSTPILNRAGQRMVEGTAEAPGAEATIGTLIVQVIDTPVAADAQASVANRIALAKLGRKVCGAAGEVELDSSEVTLIIERAAAQMMMSVVFEQLVEATDPARLKG